MTAVAETPQYTVDDYIPAMAWGKDHWSTLAYVETVAVECQGFQVGSDSRMRSNRRNFRVMQACPRPRRPGPRAAGIVMSDGHGTRLKDGTLVDGHDDWNCLQDLAEAGLFTLAASGVEPGVTLHLSAKGQAWCAALRAHKQNGGMYSNVNIAAMPEIEAAPPEELETFTFKGIVYNVTGILDDLESGALKPATTSFDRNFIELFATQVHGFDRGRPQSEGVSIWTGVRACDVHAVPDSAFDKPVILLHAGKNKGMLAIDGTGAHYLLADGNKRMGKAFFAERPTVNAVILTRAQSRKYVLG